MKIFSGSLMLALILSFSAIGQNKKVTIYANTISPRDLKAHLSILASDSLQGRETGAPGIEMAADYIAAHFKKLGLQPTVDTENGLSYFQTYPLRRINYRTAYLKKGNEQKENFQDFLYYSRSETMGEEFIDLVFMGEKQSTDLKEMDLSDKYIVITTAKMENWREMMSDLNEFNSLGVLLIIEDVSRYDFIMSRYSRYLKRPRMSLNTEEKADSKVLIGNPELAEWIFGMPLTKMKELQTTASARVILNADMLVENISSDNVLGFLEGSEKPEEIVVITSHYDHDGINLETGEIYNGADDDGSGTVTVMELAEAFVAASNKNDGPRRSILFMTFSGEEKGLLGSKYYADNPVFPMENTVVNLNVDMVGRVDEAHMDNPNYVYVIGADKLSQELHQISEQANQTYGDLFLDYKYNADDDPNRFYSRSDHYNFAKKNVPVIFYFNGTHADYHKPTDTIEKINFELMSKRAKLVFYTAWELANRDERIQLDQ